jgi:Tol biopolymer transport system component
MRRGGFESHIYRLDVSSGELRALTAGPRPEGSAEISPDGRRVATTIEDEVSDVIEFSLETGKGRRMPSPSRRNAWPVWAHSGREYAWVCTFGGKTRVLFQGESGPARALEILAPDPIRRIDLSPDGQRLTLDGYGSKHRAMLVGVNGGTPVEVDPPNSDTHGAVFSPDGEWIAYTRYADGGGQLAKIPASGGGTPIDLVKTGPSPGNALRWSPAGDWIAYAAPPGELRLVSPDGKAQRLLLKFPYFGFAFNSKGDRIYGLRRDEKRQWAVWSVGVATGVERKEIALDVPPHSNPVGFDLHPDGKRFLTTVGTSDSEIWIVDGLTGK